MAEVVIYLLQQAGPPVLFIAFGFIADQLATKELKVAVVRWMSRTYTPSITRRRLSRFLRVFLDGFIHRIFGRDFFSVSFFLRSCLVSIIFFGLAICIQLIYHPAEMAGQFAIIRHRPEEAALFLLVVFLMNFGVDYISNILTISFLRMAMLTGRVFDTLIVFVADITLTITIFTFVFPIGVTVAALATEKNSEKATLEILPPTKWTQGAAEDRLKKTLDTIEQETRGIWEVRLIEFAIVADEGVFVPFDNPSGFTTLVIRGTSESEAIKLYSDAMRGMGIFERMEPAQGQAGRVVNISLQAYPVSMSMLWDMYRSTYKQANVMRDSLIKLLLLEPVQISFSSIYNEYQNSRDRSGGKSGVVALCRDGEVEVHYSSEIEGHLGKCGPTLILPDFSKFDYWWGMKRFLSIYDAIPMTPFFFTSFASSILYYALIIVSLVGLALLRLVRTLYTSPYLDTPRLPFSVLGTAIAIALLTIQWGVRIII